MSGRLYGGFGEGVGSNQDVVWGQKGREGRVVGQVSKVRAYRFASEFLTDASNNSRDMEFLDGCFDAQTSSNGMGNENGKGSDGDIQKSRCVRMCIVNRVRVAWTLSLNGNHYCLDSPEFRDGCIDIPLQGARSCLRRVRRGIWSFLTASMAGVFISGNVFMPTD